MKRRTFLKSSSLAAGGMFLTFPIFGKNAPSNKVVVAVMGLNSRGSFHVGKFSKLTGVEVGYICDVEDNAIKKGLDAAKDVTRKPIVEKDIRKLVAKKDFDALVIAAPDHWHTPAALMGVANGKHVYVEKPCGHNPYESELLIQAQVKYGKVIQVGSQRRSFPNLIEAAKLVKEGIIGNPYMGKAWYTNNRGAIGTGKVIPVPATLDFELWQGPAPRKEFKDNIVHYNWHWFWHWGTGESCNNGNHEIDCLRWFMGVDYPTKVTSAGGRYAYKDDWETPDTQIASFEFADRKTITWEGRSCNSYPSEGGGRGFIVYGDKGTLVNGAKLYDNKNKLIREIKTNIKADSTDIVSSTGDADVYHQLNFIESIRGNTKATASIEEGHKSVLLCHLSNIAQRTGTTLHCDPKNGHILNNKEAEKLWSRTYEKGWEIKSLAKL
ncbi:Gfo/Idh/MocA family protein [Flavitalea antarctica]